jgi:chromosomal replication initiator protein
MLADCQPPDIETMQAIIAQKSNSQQVFIPQNVSAFIANGVPSGNVREVEGIVNRLVERSKLEQTSITLQFAKIHLRGIITESIEIRLDVKTILQSISNTFNVSVSDLQSENRSKRMSHPRQIAMYFLREYTNLSTTDIAKELKKNHSTVVYGVQRIQKELETDTNLQQTINLIKRDLQIIT